MRVVDEHREGAIEARLEEFLSELTGRRQ
jgi:hypothetical protein